MPHTQTGLPMPTLNRRMANGIVWMVLARLIDRGIGIVSTLILARLLVPGDFGLVAMATAVGGVLDLMSAFSFDLALIQNANATRRHYDTVWTFNVIFGLVCGCALLALAGPAAAFYSEPRLAMVMCVLSLSYFVGGFGNVGVVAFRKELNFRQEFNFVLARRVVTFVVTIGAAFVLYSYWALLIGMTVGRIVGVGISYRMNSYRPRLDLSAASELFHFSKWLLVNNVLFFLLHDGCTFIIGRLFGANELGIYAISYEISNLPSTELVAPINRATLPGFSKMQDAAEISLSYLKLLGTISTIILPVGLGIAAVAQPLVLALLGAKWMDAIPLIQLMAIHGAIGATQGNNSTVWMALGKPRNTTLLAGGFLLVLFPALYFLLKAVGIVGAGYAYLLATACTLPYTIVVTKRLLGFSWSAWLTRLWRPAASVALMYAGVQLLDSTLHAAAPLLRLMIDAGAGALLYVLLLLAMWQLAGRPDGAERYLLDKALRR
ncbi:lipopolysaccharide biosynthesis protein ['Massilia aquatica' Lu et al. 2020]|uniref:Oligosaccharide flippase family protein n=1 Tax=Pseudoduganella aquatica TaxID=2660641 RepID=A0A7X4KQA6_9BURK|nr:oligosaccharide flippase family protein [Pseudoduganella aquatica]